MALVSNLESPRRLQALAETCLVNSPPEDSFDRYTRLCSGLLKVPIALVVFVETDRIYLKSRCTSLPIPLGHSMPATHTFCRHVILQNQAFVVGDCRRDPRTHDSLAVTKHHIRAYAGLPVRTPEGEVIGTFCAMDFQPRDWNDLELEQLSDLRNGTESEIALRLQLFRLDASSAEVTRHLHSARRLIRNLGHEVRTPLNALVNLSQACAELALPPQAAQFISTLQDSSERLAQLIEGFLELAVIETNQANSLSEVVEIRTLLTGLESMVNSLNRDGLSMQSVVAAELPERLWLDGRRLSQLLVILSQTHLKKSQGKGQLQLKALWRENPSQLDLQISCRSYQLNPEEQSCLFTCSPEGIESVGLSSTLVLALAELLDARLWPTVDSDGWTHFHLRVPTRAVEPSPAVNPVRETVSLGILAIDDDATNLRVLEFLVRKLGHQITTATSGADGIALLVEKPYDLLLLDLRMPEMDGFEVARRIREGLHLSLPIVAVTADSSPAARLEATRSGIDHFLTKPLRKADIQNVLDFVHKGAQGNISETL